MLRSTLLFSLAAACAAPALSQSLIPAEVQAAFARPQQMVDIGGRRLNLYCSGSGPVTVVFDAQSGDAGWSWFEVQPHVAKRTRACVYDRAGLGFSDPSPRPGTLDNAVDDLHKLLGAAGIAPPYVMVGSSYGGGNAQLYAYRYPGEVKGLVLAEPQLEDETARLAKASGGKLQQMVDQMAAQDAACVAQSKLGFAPGSEAWANCIGTIPDNRSRVLAAAQLAERVSPQYWQASHSENTNGDTGNAALRAARAPFGALPLIVLSRGLSQYAIPGKPESALSKAFEAENRAMYQELAALSTRGVHRVVPGAHHVIHLEQPEAVVKAIDEMLNTVQR
jgi:pimeloyl-ACP methyl ester carboxylesterase